MYLLEHGPLMMVMFGTLFGLRLLYRLPPPVWRKFDAERENERLRKENEQLRDENRQLAGALARSGPHR
jgi:hypothetical protein